MQKKKRADKGGAKQTPPPNNHNWVPINQWKIAHLLPVACPVNRIKTALILMTVRLSQERQHPKQAIEPLSAPPPRLSQPAANKTPSPPAMPTHFATLTHLESLQNRFFSEFSRLDTTQQQTLIDYFLVHNLGIWSFEKPDEAPFLDAREYIEPKELTPERSAHFDLLMQRLSQILAQHQSSEQALDFETIDSVFGGDNQEWAYDTRLLYRLLESLILQLVKADDQQPCRKAPALDLRH